MKKLLLTLIILTILSTLFIGCAKTASSTQAYDNIVDVGIITHNHWTQNDINDGQIVYLDLINNHNEAISDNIKGLSINISIKGSDGSTKDLTVPLFNNTYNNVNYADIGYPQGKGLIILFNNLNGYENMSFAGIWTTVTLPDGRIVNNLDPYDFPIKPITYGQ